MKKAMDMTPNNRKAIEACYFMQPDVLAGMIEEGSFDKSLLEDIGGIRCPIPIYYITKLWNLALSEESWSDTIKPQVADAHKRNMRIADIWLNTFGIDVASLNIEYGNYACSFKDGGNILIAKDSVLELQKADIPHIDIDLYRATVFFDYSEVERLLKAGADGQILYNMDEKKFEMTDLGMCTRHSDLWNIDIVFPFKDNCKMDIPIDALNLMEACALKKLIGLFEKYGAHKVDRVDNGLNMDRSLTIEEGISYETAKAILRGDIHFVKSMLKAQGSPIPIASWHGERRGLFSKGKINSFQLSQAMFDALRDTKYSDKYHIKEIWNLHKALFPSIERTPYDQFDFIIWNWMEEPEDNPYIDDEDYEFLLQDGVPEINIRLTNCGIQHMEDEVVRLLKEGASPYFLCHAPYITNIHEDKNGNIQHTYFDVAPMLEVTKCHSCDYWLDFNLDDLDKDISSFDRPKIESIIEGLFNVGACERILHLTDEYICNKARLEGEDLMLHYLGEIHPIVK